MKVHIDNNISSFCHGVESDLEAPDQGGTVKMYESSETLQNKIQELEKIVESYQRILNLNEEEIKNAQQIIQMYENICEFARKELKDAKETVSASEMVISLSRDELMKAMDTVQKLSSANEKLNEEKRRLKEK